MTARLPFRSDPCGRRRISLLKPEPANRKQISFRYIRVCLMQDGLRQERMKMVVVNHFPPFEDTESGTDLRCSPPAGLDDTERNGTCVLVPGEGVTLRGRKADVSFRREARRAFSSSLLRNSALPVIRCIGADDFRSFPREGRQDDRQDEYNPFHAAQR